MTCKRCSTTCPSARREFSGFGAPQPAGTATWSSSDVHNRCLIGSRGTCRALHDRCDEFSEALKHVVSKLKGRVLSRKAFCVRVPYAFNQTSRRVEGNV